MDAPGRAGIPRPPAVSTKRPACMTAIRSASEATTPRSCVTSRSAMPNSRQSSGRSAIISACTVTSSAVVGSSANSSARARRQCKRDCDALAHAAREFVRVLARACRTASGRCTQSSIAPRFGSAPRRRVIPRRARATSASWSPMRRCGVRLPLGILEYEADAAPREPRPLASPRAEQLHAVEAHGTRGPAIRREQARAGVQELALAGTGLADDCDALACQRSTGRRRRPRGPVARAAKSTVSARTSSRAVTGPSDRGRRAGRRPGS